MLHHRPRRWMVSRLLGPSTSRLSVAPPMRAALPPTPVGSRPAAMAMSQNSARESAVVHAAPESPQNRGAASRSGAASRRHQPRFRQVHHHHRRRHRCRLLRLHHLRPITSIMPAMPITSIMPIMPITPVMFVTPVMPPRPLCPSHPSRPPCPPHPSSRHPHNAHHIHAGGSSLSKHQRLHRTSHGRGDRQISHRRRSSKLRRGQRSERSDGDRPTAIQVR